MTEEQLTEAATLSCSCEPAELYRKRVQRVKLAKEHIDKLFGDEADRFKQSDAVREYMKQGVGLINDKAAKNLTINLDNGLKCRIAAMADDQIKVSREIKSVVEYKR